MKGGFIMTPHEERNWSMFTHFSAFAGLVIPFGNILVPLFIWQLKKNESELIDKQGKAAVNFQITMTMAMIISTLMIFFVIGLPLFFILLFLDVALIIVATVKSARGEDYRYPFSLNLLR